MWPFGSEDEEDALEEDEGGCEYHHFDEDDLHYTRTFGVGEWSDEIYHKAFEECQHTGCTERKERWINTGLTADDIVGVKDGSRVVVDTETLDEIEGILYDIAAIAENESAETYAEVAREMVADMMGDDDD